MLESGRPSKNIAFEIGDGSEEENVTVPVGSGTDGEVRSCIRSGVPVKPCWSLLYLSWKQWQGQKLTKLVPSGISNLVVDLLVRQLCVYLLCLTLWKLLGRSIIQINRLRVFRRIFLSSTSLHLDLVHQMTSFMADELIHFAKAAGLQVSLAPSRKLADLLLKFSLVGGMSGDVEKVFGRSSCPGRAGTVTSESVAFVPVYSLLTVRESVKSERVAVVGSHESCSSRQADEVLSSMPTIGLMV